MACGSDLTRVAWPVAVRSIRLIAPSPIFGSRVGGRLGIVAMMISALMNAASSEPHLIRKTMI
jgi:hypothetical protein